MSPLLTALTIISEFGISIGQLLFKKAASVLPEHADWQHWVFNSWLIAALALYGMTTLLWIAILRYAPLQWAYPFMGLAFIIVPALAWMIFGEPFTLRNLAGGILILIGIAVGATQNHA